MVAYYNRGAEDERLLAGSSRLERLRTEELLRRFMPPPPATLLDVGGGSGHYAAWLSELGYTVHLLDPISLHVEQARRRLIASAQTGDARALPFADASADGVLLLGPLYHLTTAEDRLAALREAWRVLRPGGVIAAAVICRFASALDGMVRHLFADPRYAPIADRDLTDGQHRGLADDYFTTAYLHHPSEVAPEIERSGFERVSVLAIEGPGWLLQDFERTWSDAALREALLNLVRRTESEPTLQGASSHLLAVGHKP